MDEEIGAQLLVTMPMRFSGLVLENTNRCNAKCGMCYQSSGPKGSDVLGKAHLPFGIMEKAIREAREVPTLLPRFHLAGGEAFMHLDECIALFKVAVEAGYVDITGTTNATWARSTFAAKNVATQLRDSGVTSLEISWDYWHSPYINPEMIGQAIRACFDVEIETNLRVLTTKSHNLHEALQTIPEADLERVNRITSGPVFATGRAAQLIPIEEIHIAGGGLDGACHSTLNLTVNAFGNVFPCCAGFDQTNLYNFGNIKHESIIDIADRINNDPIARVVVFCGIKKLVPIIERAGIKLNSDFKGICQLCWTIFSSPECVQALREHAETARERALNRLVNSLGEYDA